MQFIIDTIQSMAMIYFLIRLGRLERGEGCVAATCSAGREAGGDDTGDGGRSQGDCAHSPDKTEDAVRRWISTQRTELRNCEAEGNADIEAGYKEGGRETLRSVGVKHLMLNSLERCLKSESRRVSRASVPANGKAEPRQPTK